MLRTGIAGFVGVLVGAAVVGVATSQQDVLTAKVVKAESFVAVDMDGNQRARLWVYPDGSPNLAFYDRHGKTRLAMRVAGGASGLSMHDAHGNLRAQLSLFHPDGSARLWLLDADGAMRVSMGEDSEDDSTFLRLNDTGGRTRAELNVRSDGHPALGLADADRNRRASLWVSPSGSPHLALDDADGKTIWKAP